MDREAASASAPAGWLAVLAALTRRTPLPGISRYLWPGVLTSIVVLSVALRSTFPALQHYPSEFVIPLQRWINALFDWLAYTLDFGLFTFHDVTRGLADVSGWLLDLANIAFVSGLPGQGTGPLPWVTTALGAGLMGLYAGGWRLAWIGVGCFTYLAVFGLWHASMQTFALVIMTVPVATLIGLALGILMTRRPWVERLSTPLLNVMQATPNFAYLTPVVLLFGVGQVSAMMATLVFAVPPMARNVLLGLRAVPAEVIEAARMSGCTRRQLLWKVELPSARATIMMGINQVIMMTLAMVVIASLIGATGLGFDLLNSLQSLKLGQALQEGLAIVVIAVALDRISRGYARKSHTHSHSNSGFAARHPYVIWGGSLLLASIVLAVFVPAARVLPDDLTITTAAFWGGLIDYVTMHFYDFFMAVRTFLLLHLLMPFRAALLWLPFPAMVASLAFGAWYLGGARVALMVASLALFPAVTGFWEPTMITLYMIGTAVVLCIIIGFPIGVIASRHDRLAAPLMVVCDTLQTFPSFIYLIPVIMVFKVGDVAAITAVVIYAVVPIIRYTNQGLRQVPVQVIEAARTVGCTRRQLLWKVQIPVALPEIMLGLNQTVMMGLFMVAITSLIGTQDLGQEINRALSSADPGRALVAGLCIAVIGLIADRFISTWAEDRKRQLGLV